MVNYNYCPFTDANLLNIIFRVEIPAKKKQLFDCLAILESEWNAESHSPQFWTAGQVIGDFMKCHLF